MIRPPMNLDQSRMNLDQSRWIKDIMVWPLRQQLRQQSRRTEHPRPLERTAHTIMTTVDTTRYYEHRRHHTLLISPSPRGGAGGAAAAQANRRLSFPFQENQRVF